MASTGMFEWDPNLSISGVSYFGGALMCSSVFAVEAWVKEKKAPHADPFLTMCTGGAKFSFDFKFDTFTTGAIQKVIYFDVGDWYSVAIG